ncbi:hypothetical protein M2138_000747 [Dysgonomonadaceae bacterium PH5-43]|nr:hypothetical protein [Dysgonomonadaceae bacterium PH5-43]
MKKSFLLIISALVLTSLTVNAQIKYGLKAGVNLSKVSISDGANNLDPENYTGFQVGPMVEFTVPIIGLGLDAAIMYSQQGLKVNDESKKLSTLFIPINLKYKITFMNVVGAYAAVGPYASLNLGNNDFSLDALAADVKAKSFGAGLNFGIGVELLSKLQVGVNYQLGLTEDFKATTVGGAATELFNGKQRGWTVSAAYFF